MTVRGTVVQRFDYIAEVHAANIAIRTSGESLSYAEVKALSERFARGLAAAGVKPDDRVAVLVERSLELPVLLLAILRLGAVFVPIDPGSPPQRQRRMFERTHPSLCIADPGLADSLDTSVRTLTIEGVSKIADAQPVFDAELSPSSSESPAYIMFTSGSTGLPKGVVVPHRGILRLVVGADYVELGPGQTLLQIGSIAFDASTFEIWGALLNGGTLVMMPPGPPTMATIEEYVRRFGVTTALFTTGLFHAIIDELPSALAGLQQVIAGGDAMSAVHVRRLTTLAPKLHIINGYGPTEATTFAVCHRVVDGATQRDPVPIGRAINGTDIHVLDEALRPVGVGEVGELCIGGDGVALGYFGDEDSTRAAFVPDPSAPSDLRRLYRTGDLVRVALDGTYVFLGRRDAQVKIRGFRVELGEIEARLREHPSVRDVVVVACPDPALMDKILAATVVLTEEAEDDWQAQLTRHTRASLPEVMVPKAWERVFALPLGPTGKVDRRQVGEGAFAALNRAADTAGDASTTPQETMLLSLCRDLLPVRVIELERGFIEQGGDSLRAARLVARLGKVHNARLALHEVLQAESLRLLAELVVAADGLTTSTGAGALTASHASPRQQHQASLQQEQLWLLHRDGRDRAVYNEAILITTPHELGSERVAVALAELVRRHATLGATYVLAADGSTQVRHAPQGPLPLEVLDDADFDDAALRAVHEPFSLETGPLSRAVLAPTPDGGSRLLVVLHHISYDGGSLFGILLPEFQALCAGRQLDSLPAGALCYGDYAEQQRARLDGGQFNAALAGWEEILSDLPAAPSDLGGLSIGADAASGCPVDFTLTVDLVASIRAMARAESVSSYTVLAAAVHVVMMRYTRQPEWRSGFVQDLRPPGFEGVVGGFINTLVLRTARQPAQSVRGYLHHVWNRLCEAQRHNEAPYPVVAAQANQRLGLRGRELFDVMVSYDPPMPDLPDGWRASHLSLEKRAAKFPLSVELGDQSDGSMYGRVEHLLRYISGPAAERFVQHFVTVLKAFVRDPAASLDAVPLVSGPARGDGISSRGARGVGTQWRCPADVLRDAAVHDPDGEALVYGQICLTYGELIARASAAAAEIVRDNEPGRPVAIYMQDPLERAVAMWGAWLAGAAPMCLDPEYPAATLRACLAAVPTALVLVDQTCSGRPGLEQRDVRQLTATWSAATAPVDPASEWPAYMVLTSGSTGAPKVVVISNRNATEMVAAHRDRLGPDVGLRRLQTAGPSFDAYISELLFTAANRGTLVLADRREILPGPELVSLVAEQRVNDAFFTPSLLAYLDPTDFPTLHTVFCAGEACPPALAAPWVEAGIRFIHAYGPAECTVCTTLDIITSTEADFLPLGDPLPGYQVHLLDDAGCVVPTGVIGELCIGGIGVGLGYLNDPETTTRSFVPDPFSLNPTARLYRSGDLARYHEDGRLEFIGREDQQVKIRGMRIELGEVEALLGAHTFVEATAVIKRDALEESGEPSLVAYVVLSENPDTGWRPDLALALRNGLPAHAVPSHIVAIDSLPLNLNGKLDHARLQAAAESDRLPTSARSSATALTELEHDVWKLWREFFPDAPSDPTLDFFDLGGHSLLAVRLLAAFNRHFHVQLTVRGFFDHPTVEAMAAWLQAPRAPVASSIAGDSTFIVPPRLGDSKVPRPTSFVAAGHTPAAMLTGATGFVGRFLLRHLLEVSDQDVFCLVRGDNGAARVLRALDDTGQWPHEWADRMKIIGADLAGNSLGISKADRLLLEQQVNDIYHCGAMVNSLFPYSVMRAANVEGTRALLQLAASSRESVFHHISTVGIFSGEKRLGDATWFDERSFPSAAPPLEDGYNASKWASEALVRQAAAQGMKTVVYRVGRAACSVRAASWNQNDFVWRLLTASLQAGCLPRLTLALKFVDVDHVAHSIAAMANESLSGETFHLLGRQTMTWDAICSELKRRRPHLDQVSYEQWWDRVTDSPDASATLSGLLERLRPGGQALDEGLNIEGGITDSRTDRLALSEPKIRVTDIANTLLARIVTPDNRLVAPLT